MGQGIDQLVCVSQLIHKEPFENRILVYGLLVVQWIIIKVLLFCTLIRKETHF